MQSRKAPEAQAAAQTPSITMPRRPTGRPLVMGIVNVTPDSFSDGGAFLQAKSAIDHGLELVRAGADILDIGGESTRPGSDPVSEQEEMDRVLPVVAALARQTDRPISIDTMKPRVAEEAVKAGAHIWNDVTALGWSNASAAMAAQLDVPVILMHMLGQPKTMQRAPVYGNVVEEVIAYLRDRIRLAVKAGVKRSQILVDPGIGFGKTLEHNIALLGNLDRIRLETGCPLLLGASRKRFIEAVSAGADAQDRLGGSLATVSVGAQQKVWGVRVHDVRETRQFLDVRAAICEAGDLP